MLVGSGNTPKISIVFQEVTLFNSSIKDNIRIGKKGATDEEIVRAAKIARYMNLSIKCRKE